MGNTDYQKVYTEFLRLVTKHAPTETATNYDRLSNVIDSYKTLLELEADTESAPEDGGFTIEIIGAPLSTRVESNDPGIVEVSELAMQIVHEAYDKGWFATVDGTKYDLKSYNSRAAVAQAISDKVKKNFVAIKSQLSPLLAFIAYDKTFSGTIRDYVESLPADPPSTPDADIESFYSNLEKCLAVINGTIANPFMKSRIATAQKWIDHSRKNGENYDVIYREYLKRVDFVELEKIAEGLLLGDLAFNLDGPSEYQNLMEEFLASGDNDLRKFIEKISELYPYNKILSKTPVNLENTFFEYFRKNETNYELAADTISSKLISHNPMALRKFFDRGFFLELVESLKTELKTNGLWERETPFNHELTDLTRIAYWYNESDVERRTALVAVLMNAFPKLEDDLSALIGFASKWLVDTFSSTTYTG